MVRKTFRVTNMECPSCAMRLEGLEDDLPGIRMISASYRKARLEVEFDERLTSEADIIAAAGKMGYQATPE